MTEILIRFVVGGIVVSFFASLGDVLKPNSFAGLFGAAPSVALATLALTVFKEGPAYAQLEARSMMLGAVAFFFYAWLITWLLMRKNAPALLATSGSIVLWLGIALGLRFLIFS